MAARRGVKGKVVSAQEVERLVREMADLREECPSDEHGERALAMRSEEPVLPSSYWDQDLADPRGR